MAAQIFPFGTALTVVWHLTKPDGTLFDLSGYTYRVYYRTGNKETEVNSQHLDPVRNNLWISIPASEPVAPGEYAMRLVLYQNGNLFCTINYNAAFVLSRRFGAEALPTENQEEAGQTVHLFTVAEFYLLQPVIPTIGLDKNWYVNGVIVTDSHGDYVSAEHTVRYDEDTKCLIIDEGRVDSQGQSIQQTITDVATALADWEARYVAAEGSSSTSVAGDGSRWGSYKSAEAVREENETARKDAEGTPSDAAGANTRWGAEKQRIANETARQTAEGTSGDAAGANTRWGAEKQRIANETARQTAEGTSGDAAGANTRWGAEKQRQLNETARQEAEGTPDDDPTDPEVTTRWAQYKRALAATERANEAAAAAEHQVDVKRGYSIESVTQPVVSTTNGGVNTIRVTTEDNKTFDFYVRNGKSSAGFFSTATALNTAIPSPNAGDYAFVSEAGDGTFPAYIYVCTTAGTWTATENEFTPDDPTDVLDVLNSTSTTAALSAKQGKVLNENLTQLGQKVTDLTDFAYNTSINGIRYYDNYQWLTGTTKTTATRQGGTGRAAFYPIPCKKGDVFRISVGYFGWQQTQVVAAAVVDDNYTILERFHPSGEANALNFQFTITADNAKYLLINSYNTSYDNGVDKNWYYTEPNGFISYLKKDLFRADSLVFNQYNKESKLTFSKSGTSVVVDFSANPYIFSTGGKAFRLFPSDASTFQLTIPAMNVCYVDASLVENSTFASPVYLSASDIKMESASGAFDIKGKIVLALTTNAVSIKSGLFNIGAIGHYYYDNPITEQKSVRSAFPDAPDYGNLILEKCPKFSTMMREKNKDVCVVFTGTSLTQGNRYTTEVSNPTECPPSLFANDLCGTIFRRLVKSWEGQKYRRYDHTDLTYTGTWEETDDAVVNGTSIWDDVTKRGLTKTTVSSGASVSIQVPTDAWQFNFIYRSDSEGGICTVSITQGNGKMEVYNGTSWVEANGYQFSMLEPAATDTKGNTCYQRRLKMRCKNKASGGINSIGTAKTLTITKAADSSRMNVVGFEWSPREFMFTLINGARRNYAWGKWNSSRNLEYFQDSDIWAFAPDLVVAEVTVVNWNTDSNHDPLEYVNDTKIAYFNEYGTDAKSLWEKSDHYQACEVIFYGDTFWTGATADWDANGDAVFKTVASAATNAPAQYQSDENVGRVQNIFEIYDAVDRYMLSKDYIFIPVIRTFKAVAESFYGSYKKGFTTSGANGDTLTYDATHLNDNGAALWAHIIAPIFDAIIGLPAK